MLSNLKIVPSAEARNELLAWLNTTMPSTAPNGLNVAPMHKVEQCGNGIPYVLLLPTMLPISYPPLTSATRVKVPANHDFEAIANIKLIQDALHRNGVNRPDVLMNESSKIIKGNFQANLQLLQWFKGFYDALTREGIESAQVSKLAIMPPPHSELSASGKQQTLMLDGEASPDVQLSISDNTMHGTSNVYELVQQQQQQQQQQEQLQANENNLCNGNNESKNDSYKSGSPSYNSYKSNSKTNMTRTKALSTSNNINTNTYVNKHNNNNTNNINRRCSSVVQYRNKTLLRKPVEKFSSSSFASRQHAATKDAANDSQLLATIHKEVMEQGNVATANAIALLNSDEPTIGHEQLLLLSEKQEQEEQEEEIEQKGEGTENNNEDELEPNVLQESTTTTTTTTTTTNNNNNELEQKRRPSQTLTVLKSPNSTCSRMNSRINSASRVSLAKSIRSTSSASFGKLNANKIDHAKRLSIHDNTATTTNTTSTATTSTAIHHENENNGTLTSTTTQGVASGNVKRNSHKPSTAQHRSASAGVSKVSRHNSSAPSGSFVSTVSSAGHSFLQSVNKSNLAHTINGASSTPSSSSSLSRRAQSMSTSVTPQNRKYNNTNNGNHTIKGKTRTSVTGAPALMLGVDKSQRKGGFVGISSTATLHNNTNSNRAAASANINTNNNNNSNSDSNCNSSSNNSSSTVIRSTRSMSNVNFGRNTRVNKLAATTTNTNITPKASRNTSVLSSPNVRRPFSATKRANSSSSRHDMSSRERSPSLSGTVNNITNKTTTDENCHDKPKNNNNINNNTQNTLPPQINEDTEMVILERQFYYDKLRLIENIIRPIVEHGLANDNSKTSEVANTIL